LLLSFTVGLIVVTRLRSVCGFAVTLTYWLSFVFRRSYSFGCKY